MGDLRFLRRVKTYKQVHPFKFGARVLASRKKREGGRDPPITPITPLGRRRKILGTPSLPSKREGQKTPLRKREGSVVTKGEETPHYYRLSPP